MSEILWRNMDSPQTFVAACIEEIAPGFLPTGNWTVANDHWVGWITDFHRWQRVRLKIDRMATAEVIGHIHAGSVYRRHLFP